MGCSLSTTTIVVSEGGPPKAVAEAQVLEAEAVLPAPKADEADNPPKEKEVEPIEIPVPSNENQGNNQTNQIDRRRNDRTRVDQIGFKFDLGSFRKVCCRSKGPTFDSGGSKVFLEEAWKGPISWRRPVGGVHPEGWWKRLDPGGRHPAPS